jgi:nicotinamidase/pyrazinamidase
MYHILPNDALIVVDPQNDFLPGGSLGVAEAHRIFDPINRIMPYFTYVLATRDWHAPDHAYFEARGGPWPFHCLAGTPGAEFSDRLHTRHVHEIVSKGTDSQTDGYSGFAGTDLAERLRSRAIARVFVCGLATDYCVKATAIEAVENGFSTVVLTDAIAAVNLAPGDEEAALRAMEERGVLLATTQDLEIAQPV